MATPSAAAAGPELPSGRVTERDARFSPGLRMLVLGIVGLLAGVAICRRGKSPGRRRRRGAGCALRPDLSRQRPGAAGLTPVVPGQARVVQLFGRYHGTIRDSGLQWVNPFTRRIAVSTRIRNQESAQAKVNDADGNPIEIAAVVAGRSPTPPVLSTLSMTTRSSSPSRPRPPSGTSPPPTPTPAAGKASCRCAITPTRSPAGSPPRSPRESHRPGCTSSSRG